MNGARGLQCANHSIHKQDIGQCLLDILWILGEMQLCQPSVNPEGLAGICFTEENSTSPLVFFVATGRV